MNNSEQNQNSESPISKDQRVIDILHKRTKRSTVENKQSIVNLRAEITNIERSVADIIQRIYLITIINPAITEDEIVNMIQEESISANLPTDYTEHLTKSAERFIDIKNKINEISKEDITPKERFFNIFGFEPSGRVVAELTPISLILRVSDKDFDRAYIESSLADKEPDGVKAVSIKVHKNQAPGLWKYTDLIVLVREDADRDTIDHEQQHKYNALFNAVKKTYREDAAYRGEEKHKSLKGINEKKEHRPSFETITNTTEAVTKSNLRIFGSQIKDELLAYYRQNMPKDVLLREFPDAYLKNYILGMNIVEQTKLQLKEIQGEDFIDDKDIDAMISKSAIDYLSRYTSKLYSAFETLSTSGMDKESIITLLHTKSAEDWLATARRHGGA